MTPRVLGAALARQAAETTSDQAARRQGVRRRLERGCWLYVPAAQLVELGYPLDQPPPYYRTWPGRKRTLLVQFYAKR